MSDEIDAVLKELYDHARGGASRCTMSRHYQLLTGLAFADLQSLRRMTPSAQQSSSKASFMTRTERRACAARPAL